MHKALGRVVAGFKLCSVFARFRCSTLYVGRHEGTGLEVLIRDVDLSFCRNECARARLVRDLTILKSAWNSQQIIRLFDVVESDGHLFVICERLHNGTLKKLITRIGLLSARKAKRLLAELVIILDVLHNDLRICHGNINVENILLDKNFNARIIDFGQSQQIIKQDAQFSGVCGTTEFVAPEVVKGNPYTKAVDIWSMGVLFYFVVVGRTPFEEISSQEILRKILEADPVFPSDTEETVVDLIRRMLDKEPEHRITLAEIQAHPFFEGTDWARMARRDVEVSDDRIQSFLEASGIDTSDEIMRAVARKEVELEMARTDAVLEVEPQSLTISKRRETMSVDTNKQMKVLAFSLKVKKNIIMQRRAGAFTDVSSDVSAEPFGRAKSDFA